MPARPKLPRILSFRITGFHPVFSNAISMLFNDGPYVILGGNGLGKTTLSQAIVYGLAGGLSTDAVESIKSFRWNHTYFRGRLDSQHVSRAFVEVDFAFAEKTFSVRRGFRGSEVLAFRENGPQASGNPPT